MHRDASSEPNVATMLSINKVSKYDKIYIALPESLAQCTRLLTSAQREAYYFTDADNQ